MCFIRNQNVDQPAKVHVKKNSQLALSPLLRKSPSSGFTVMPVLSHILWISDMQSLGFRRKKRRPFRIVRLCWFQSHRYCRCWLLMAENEYMLTMEGDQEKVTTTSQKGTKHLFRFYWTCVIGAEGVRNVVKKFCHLVAALCANRGGHGLALRFVCLSDNEPGFAHETETVLTPWAKAVQVTAAEHLQSEGNVCHPGQHSSEWNFTLGETTTRRVTGFPMTPLAITKKTFPHI